LSHFNARDPAALGKLERALTFFPPRIYHGEQKFHTKQIEAEVMPALTSFGAWQLRPISPDRLTT